MSEITEDDDVNQGSPTTAVRDTSGAGHANNMN